MKIFALATVASVATLSASTAAITAVPLTHAPVFVPDALLRGRAADNGECHSLHSKDQCVANHCL